MAMFPALMNDTMFSNLFDDPFFEGWRNMDRAAACDPNMSAGMMNKLIVANVDDAKTIKPTPSESSQGAHHAHH